MAKLKFKFNAKDNVMSIESINTLQDRKAMHEAFKIALQHSKFAPAELIDVGEHKDARPIRKDKERLINDQTQQVLE